MSVFARGRVAKVLLAGCMVASSATLGVDAGAAEPEPVYDSQVEETVHVTTRFGDRITVELVFPAVGGVKADGPFPVVACLCYISTVDGDSSGNLGTMPAPSHYARAGYVAATVRVAGSGTSEYGPWNLGDEHWQLMNYDAIEWLGTQSWSTGKVGTIGGSGNGMSQIFTSQLRPPHLVTMIPTVSGHDSYDVLMPGGIPSLQIALFGCGIPGAATTVANGLPVPIVNSSGQPLTPEELQYLVEVNAQKYTKGHFIPYCPVTDRYWQHRTRDDFWTGALRSNVEDVTIPVWAWGGWDDIFDLAIPKLYSEVGSKQKMLAMGLNSHSSPGGDDGFDRVAESIRWFDHWLKGKDNGIAEEVRSGRFRYYVNREFVWKEAPTFPIPGTDYTRFYLGSGLGDLVVDGNLRRSAPTLPGANSYLYNPLGGGMTELTYDLANPVVPNSPGTDTPVHHNLTNGDQRLFAGPDTVTYVSEPLTEDTEVTGPITARLFASSTAADTDFVVKLIDVFPDSVATSGPQPGFWNLVTSGSLKGTFRSYQGKYASETPIPVGQVVQYDLQARPVSYSFQAGHRIAVTIQSGHVPRLLPNPNPAAVTIHHSALHPSSITLPIIGDRASSTLHVPADDE